MGQLKFKGPLMIQNPKYIISFRPPKIRVEAPITSKNHQSNLEGEKKNKNAGRIRIIQEAGYIF